MICCPADQEATRKVFRSCGPDIPATHPVSYTGSVCISAEVHVSNSRFLRRKQDSQGIHQPWVTGSSLVAAIPPFCTVSDGSESPRRRRNPAFYDSPHGSWEHRSMGRPKTNEQACPLRRDRARIRIRARDRSNRRRLQGRGHPRCDHQAYLVLARPQGNRTRTRVHASEPLIPFAGPDKELRIAGCAW